MDQDYIGKLGDKDKEWLSQFNNEYYGNTLNKDWRKNLHLKDNKKAIFDQTNARNRDMYNKRYKYNEGDMREEHNIETLIASKLEIDHSSPEEAYVEYIHVKKKMLKFIQEAKESGLTDKEAIELAAKIFDIE